jgi:hypothetical protein
VSNLKGKQNGGEKKNVGTEIENKNELRNPDTIIILVQT